MITDTIIQQNEANKSNYLLTAGDYYLPSILVSLIRRHFSDPECVRIPALQNLLYKPGIAQQTKPDTILPPLTVPIDPPGAIKIQAWNEWDPSRDSSSPAILIKDNDCGVINLGLGSKHNVFPGKANVEVFTRGYAGSCTIYCISRYSTPPKLIAWEVANLVDEVAFYIKERLKFTTLCVGNIGAVKHIQEFPENFASPITIEYTFSREWHITSAEPLLKHVELTPSTQP